MITFIKKKTYLCYKALACGTGLSLGYQMTAYYDLIEELITVPPFLLQWWFMARFVTTMLKRSVQTQHLTNKMAEADIQE